MCSEPAVTPSLGSIIMSIKVGTLGENINVADIAGAAACRQGYLRGASICPTFAGSGVSASKRLCACVRARLCVLLLSSSHAYFFVGKLVCVSSSTVWQVRGCVWACTGACVHNQVCLCTGIFCVIPALLLSLAQDYYSVSDLLLPFFYQYF